MFKLEIIGYSLILLMALSILYGSFASCAWGIDPKYAFIPTIAIATVTVLFGIYATIVDW